MPWETFVPEDTNGYCDEIPSHGLVSAPEILE